MIAATESQLERVRPLFEGEHLRLVIDAVIAGNSPGKLWVDDADQPRAALLWDKTHSFYLAGIAHNPAFNQALQTLFREEIVPFALAHDLGIFKLYSTSDVWAQPIETLFAAYDLRPRERVFYRGDQQSGIDWRGQLPAGFAISEINRQFETLSALENFQLVTEEVESCWNRLDDFRQRGFGLCAHNAERVVGWCTAEYVSAGKCGIGIETVEAYQGRGFATLTASAFVEQAFAQGITPHWDAWITNLPSVRVAEKIGLRKVEEYSIYVGKFAGA